MTARRMKTVLSLLGAAALLAACSTKVPLNEAPVESRTPTPVAPGGTQPVAPSAGTKPPAATSTVATVDTAATTLAAANRAGRVVYFDFDSFVLKDEFKPLVDAHAKALVTNAARRIFVEGHADERGGREYNLALGQKRAEAVKKALALLGAREDQMEAVSLGEEKPACTDSGEACLAKNRRDDMLYTGEF